MRTSIFFGGIGLAVAAVSGLLAYDTIIAPPTDVSSAAAVAAFDASMRNIYADLAKIKTELNQCRSRPVIGSVYSDWRVQNPISTLPQGLVGPTIPLVEYPISNITLTHGPVPACEEGWTLMMRSNGFPACAWVTKEPIVAK